MDCAHDGDGFSPVRGDDWVICFPVLYPDGEPADLTDYRDAWFTMASAQAGPVLTAAGEFDRTEEGKGVVWVRVPHELTQLDPRPYRADLQLTDKEGLVTTPWLGVVTVLDDVTKEGGL
jgi:hypothetical protein